MASLFTKYKHFRRHSILSTIANTSSIQSYLNISNTHFTLSKCRTFGLKPTQIDNKMEVDYLISIFTQKRFDPGNSVELTQLGFQLTPRIVEDVLKELRSWNVAYRFFNWAKSQNGYFHNCYTYNAMASILSSVRQNAAMKSLVFDVMNSSCYMSPGALGFLIRCLGNVGLVHEANELFDRVREKGLCNPNNYSYNCLLEAIAKSSLSDLAEKRLDEMRSLRWVVDKYTLTPLLAVYCNAREFEKALMVFKEMLEKGWVDAHVLSILALSFSKWGEVDKACELIERMEECNLRLNEKTFYVLVHGFVSNNRVDKALQLFDKMLGLGISPDIAVYDVLIGGLCKKDPQGALRLYSQMKSSGICPDVGILNKLISCVTEEDIMVHLLEGSGDVIHGESLRSLYISVLKGLVSNDLVDRALGLVKMMMEDTSQHGSRLEKFFKLKGIFCLDSSSFSIIINALCEKRRLDEAFQLFKDMDRFGCPRDTTLYNNLIDALCYAERITDSLDLLNEMKKLNIQTTQFTYNSLYGYFCRKGDVKGATSIMKEMCVNRHEPWIKNSTTLVKQLCKQGRAMEASKFLAEMVQEGLVPHIILYSAAIDGLFKLQEADQALELFQIVCSRGYKPDVVAYNILINGLSKANKVAEAENMLKEMLNGGLLPSTVTYNSLIDGWCKNGDIDQALACLSKMAGENREPNIITYTTLVDGLCNAGRPGDALKLWNEMAGNSCSPNRITFMAIISGLCKNNMPEIALSYLREMKKKELKADNFVYIALMDSFLLNKNPILAFEMLKEIAEMNIFPASIDKHHTLVKDAITKLADDPLTSCNVNKLIAEGRIPMFLLCK
ncbi:putative pentatricopeptide repeat-containing protein At5g08310, mitochondrial [Silene latifolia]|uniref:putative pentatricopeptide repeat-containing protein At5g08310, mitochondrial n=1 Tax=Silene latifolia TaxID=37657 RepID=UPI003D76CA23